MSTVPGQDAWRDAGLVEVDPAGAVELEPRPDLRGEADVADVTEQAAAVPPDEHDDCP